MKLKDLLQAYDFDELMPIIADMFPGTGKYRHPLKVAYNLLMDTSIAPSKKKICYKVMHNEKYSYSTIGAEDRDFEGTWSFCLGKDVIREPGVDLSDIELAANCLINLCFISQYPKVFEEAHAMLVHE